MRHLVESQAAFVENVVNNRVIIEPANRPVEVSLNFFSKALKSMKGVFNVKENIESKNKGDIKNELSI